MHVIRFVLFFWLACVAVTGAANLVVLPLCWVRDQRQQRQARQQQREHRQRQHRPRPQVGVRQPARSSA